MRTSTFTLETADGVPVHVRRWLPDEDTEVLGVVQLIHGMQEHTGRYQRVAEALTTAGYAMYGNDLRGHGLNVADEADHVFFAEDRGWARVLDDVYRLNRRIREEHPDVPAYLLGHSMGSYLAQQFLFTFPGAIDGALLSGTSGGTDPLVEAGAVAARLERLRLGKRGRSRLLNTLAFGPYNKGFEPVRTEFDWLSSDPAEIQAYVDDPWCGIMPTTQFWIDLLSGMRVIADPERQRRIPPDLPILVFSGELDPIGGRTAKVRKLLDAYEAAGLRRVTHRFYPGRHELLFDVARDEVLADVIAWLDDVTTEHESATWERELPA
jgi:alpha-beta hydrolase superfamily lysophospholipase